MPCQRGRQGGSEPGASTGPCLKTQGDSLLLDSSPQTPQCPAPTGTQSDGTFSRQSPNAPQAGARSLWGKLACLLRPADSHLFVKKFSHGKVLLILHFLVNLQE